MKNLEAGNYQDFRAASATFDDAALVGPLEVAALMGGSDDFILRWRKEGKLPPAAIVANRLIRWRLGTIREWLKSLEAEHQGPVPRETKNLRGRPRKVPVDSVAAIGR